MPCGANSCHRGSDTSGANAGNQASDQAAFQRSGNSATTRRSWRNRVSFGQVTSEPLVVEFIGLSPCSWGRDRLRNGRKSEMREHPPHRHSWRQAGAGSSAGSTQTPSWAIRAQETAWRARSRRVTLTTRKSGNAACRIAARSRAANLGSSANFASAERVNECEVGLTVGHAVLGA